VAFLALHGAACSDAPGAPASASASAIAAASGSAAVAFPDVTTPDPGAVVEVPDFVPAPGRRLRVLIDAGHGAEKNPGNTSTFGVAEEDFTIDLALDLEAALVATGAFEVRQSRPPGKLVPYAARIAAAASMGADAFVSLHSDVRGAVRPWSPVPGLETRASLDAPGFSVLFSDEGGAALAEARRQLAVSIAGELSAAGFFPYGGQEYEGLYAGEPSAAGAFVDRHENAKRIMVLRRTAMPAVIVETHNALDPREAARWDEEHTRQAFAIALARGLVAAVAARP
jgi:N-acetylmuramoyl-L-alanine amidase